jgi:hypothetical protein
MERQSRERSNSHQSRLEPITLSQTNPRRTPSGVANRHRVDEARYVPQPTIAPSHNERLSLVLVNLDARLAEASDVLLTAGTRNCQPPKNTCKNVSRRAGNKKPANESPRLEHESQSRMATTCSRPIQDIRCSPHTFVQVNARLPSLPDAARCEPQPRTMGEETWCTAVDDPGQWPRAVHDPRRNISQMKTARH